KRVARREGVWPDDHHSVAFITGRRQRCAEHAASIEHSVCRLVRIKENRPLAVLASQKNDPCSTGRRRRRRARREVSSTEVLAQIHRLWCILECRGARGWRNEHD